MAEKFGKALTNSQIAFNGLMVLGFLGIVWLMIYGNLSGNLGFEQDSATFFNETINLTETGEIPSSADNRVDATLSNVLVTNASDGDANGLGEIVDSSNYTINGVIFTIATSSAYNNTFLNVSYTVSFDSDNDVLTETVITNMTSGATTFFAFAPTWFTIVAIVLLITILLALLFIVMKITKMSGGRGGFSD